MVRGNKFYDIVQHAETVNHNFGVWQAHSKQHAMLRLLRSKGVDAHLEKDTIVWPNEKIQNTWNNSCTWEITRC